MKTAVGTLLYFCGWPVIWLYLHFRHGARIVIEKDARYLMVEATVGSGKWSIPGGGMKRSESPESAAKREVFEETGLDLSGSKLEYLGDFPINIGRITSQNHIFFCHFTGEHMGSKKSLEIANAEWQPLAVLLENCGNPQLAKLLQRHYTA